MAKINTSLYGVLNYLAYQPVSPVLESLEWLTDVIASYNGKEQRLDRRNKPRQFLNYTIPLSPQKKAEAFNSLYGDVRSQWAIPVWTEAQGVGSLIVSQVVINCDTLLHDLRAQSLAVVYSSNGAYEVVEIESLTSTTITLMSGLANPFTNAQLIPVRIGFIKESANLKTTGYNSAVKLDFQIQDNLLITPSAPDQYLAQDIYFIESIIKSQSATGKKLESPQLLVDSKMGAVDFFDRWENTRYGSSYGIIAQGAEEIRELKEFLYRRAGKYRAFWLPTFENDIRLQSSGLLVGTMLVDSDSIIDHATDRIHMAIKDRNGNWYPREITTFIQISPTTVQLNFTPDLNVESANIDYISYLGLTRYDVDKVDLQWLGNNVVSSTSRIIELAP